MDDLKLYLSGVVCATCLSSDRNLFHLKSVPNIQGLFPKLQFDMENDRICWECNAIVLKFVKFQEKAYTSREIFQDFVEGNVKALKTQSNLKWIISINGETQQRLDTSSKIVFQNDDDKDEIDTINLDSLDNSNVTYIELVEYVTEEGKTDIENKSDWQYEALDEFEATDCNLNIPDNFEIDDKDISKLINATLKVLLDDAAKKDGNISNTDNVIIYETDGDDDCINDTECVNDKRINDNVSVNDIESVNESESVHDNDCVDENTENNCINNVVLKLDRNDKLERLNKNISRKILMENERDTMINREKQNACYRNAMFKCETCVYGYDTAREYMDHMKKHDESRGAEVCSICKQRFMDKTTLTDHWSRHYAVFYCVTCGFTSRFIKFVMNHQEKECEKSYPVWFQCDECDDEFALESLLSHHKNTMHRIERKRKFNDKMLSKNTDLKTHEQTHKSRVKVECGICHQEFVNTKSLQIHMRIHRADARKRNLNIH